MSKNHNRTLLSPNERLVRSIENHQHIEIAQKFKKPKETKHDAYSFSSGRGNDLIGRKYRETYGAPFF